MSPLKLRLNLMITALLALITLAGAMYIVRKARDDTRAEVQSTLALAGSLLDARVAALRDHPPPPGAGLLQLRELSGIRHLRVDFYDTRGRLAESNHLGRRAGAPRWFVLLVGGSAPLAPPQTRTVWAGGTQAGRLVIAPDPTDETEEMWSTARGLLGLLVLFFVLVNVVVWWAVSRAMRPVESILEALDEVRRGHLGVRLPRFSTPEMSRISNGFNHMAGTLEHSVSENRRLTRSLVQAHESERTHIARELHDEIGQYVSAIHADAAAIRNRGGEPVRESAEAIAEATSQMKEIVRSMLQRLRPPALDLGCAPALQELVAAFRQRHAGIACSLRTGEGVAGLDGEAGVAVYRVVQECLTNIARHARARQASIEVTRSAGTPGRVQVQVSDDGIGFEQPASGLGLAGIRERIRLLGGSCEIESRPGDGTRIRVEIPLEARSGEAA
ncbi:MAG TPA: ATP-binding protein [Steroidobacteraceae bacterium]|nr:ATP-binding protein [Steroidobacteraceae bacterium]